MYYLYILYSDTSDKYYIGQTDNLDRRLFQHNNSNRNTYTSKHRPWNLVASFELGNDRGVARKIEIKIKSQKSRKVILDLLNHSGDKDYLSNLVRVPICRD